MKNALILLVAVVILACNEKSVHQEYTYTKSKYDSVATNTEHNYYLSLVSGEEALPLIVLIDPQGDAKSSVDLFREVMSFMPSVIVCSEILRNNAPNYETGLSELIEDVKSKQKINAESIVLVGFSGGGRMAYSYSQSHKIAGLLMSGAGPTGPVPEIPFYGIVGSQDFNFMELYQRPVLGKVVPREYQIDYFRGKHEWPDVQSLKDGLIFLCRGFSEENREVAESRAVELLSLSDSLKGNPLYAWKSLEKAFQFSIDPSRQEKIQKKVDKLKVDKGFSVSIQSLENYLKLEVSLKQNYIDKSTLVEEDYWIDEIQKLKDVSRFSSNTLEIDHNERLMGFLGILFYSRLQVVSHRPDQQELAKNLIDAFAFLEPENPDMLYFKALFYTNQNEMDSASHYLALARKFGLKG